MEEREVISCSAFEEEIKKFDRVGVLFGGKHSEETERFVQALSDAEEYLGLDFVVVPVDEESCDNLAERLGIEEIPTVVVFAKGKEVGRVTPTEEDLKQNYQPAITRLIDLSED